MPVYQPVYPGFNRGFQRAAYGQVPAPYRFNNPVPVYRGRFHTSISLLATLEIDTPGNWLYERIQNSHKFADILKVLSESETVLLFLLDRNFGNVSIDLIRMVSLG